MTQQDYESMRRLVKIRNMKKIIFLLSVFVIFTSQFSWSQYEVRQRYHFPSEDTDYELYLLGRLIRFNLLYQRSLADYNGEGSKAIYEENNADFVNRMIKLKDKIKTDAQSESYGNLFESSRQLDRQLAKDISAGQIRTVTPPAAQPALTPPAVVANTPTTVQTRTDTGVALVDKINCIKAAFPLEYEPCVVPFNLPVPYDFAELGEQTSFSCEKPNQVCNPFLSGYVEECFTDPNSKKKKCVLDPVCVSGDQNTTVSCLKASDKESSKKLIVALWQNPKNKFAYDYTKKALDEFCKPDKIAGQTKISCQAMQERFDEIRAKAWPSVGQPPASAAPASAAPARR